MNASEEVIRANDVVNELIRRGRVDRDPGLTNEHLLTLPRSSRSRKPEIGSGPRHGTKVACTGCEPLEPPVPPESFPQPLRLCSASSGGTGECQ